MSDKAYPEFLDDMGKLLQAAMPRTDRERDELYAAEAEVRRLRSQLAIAEERQELARKRYDRERAVLMEMFGTWKAEVMSLPEPDDDMGELVTEYMGGVEGEAPVRMIPEMDTATLVTVARAAWVSATRLSASMSANAAPLDSFQARSDVWLGMLDELSESPLPGARYAYRVVAGRRAAIKAALGATVAAAVRVAGLPADEGPRGAPYGGHPEFGPRFMANQAQPSLAGWEALAKDALLAWEDCRAAALSSPETTPAGVLDEAWAAAEKALPEGWRPIHLAVDDDDWTRWEAITSSRAFFEDETSDESQMAEGSGPTPAAALHALAAALGRSGSDR